MRKGLGDRTPISRENRNKWIVSEKGKAEDSGFEISVLRKKNEHGQRSYGWFDENKILISHDGGPCQVPVSKMVWEKLIHIAYKVAEEMNIQEGIL